MRDIEKMTACTDAEVRDEYGVVPKADFSLDEHGELIIPPASGTQHGAYIDDDDVTMYTYDTDTFGTSSVMRIKRVVVNERGSSKKSSTG